MYMIVLLSFYFKSNYSYKHYLNYFILYVGNVFGYLYLF